MSNILNIFSDENFNNDKFNNNNKNLSLLNNIPKISNIKNLELIKNVTVQDLNNKIPKGKIKTIIDTQTGLKLKAINDLIITLADFEKYLNIIKLELEHDRKKIENYCFNALETDDRNIINKYNRNV